MASDWPLSVARTVTFRAYLASDGTTVATGKTIAITISKNGATSFSNPNAGATNATEMASGFYKFTLDTTDTGTAGPLSWRGAHADINDAGDNFDVVDANRGKLGALPAAAVEASGGLPTLSAAQASNGTIQANVHRWLTGTPNALQTGRVDAYVGAVAAGVMGAASFAADAFDAVWTVVVRTLTSGANIVLAKGVGVTGFNDLSAAQVNAEVDTALADYDAPTSAELVSEINAVQADVAAVSTKLGTPTNLGSGATIAANLVDIEGQTDDIGAAGAGLTALASAANLAIVDTVVDAIKVTTDHLETALELDGVVYRFTENALEEAPTGGGSGGGDCPTAAEIADAVWEEPIADHDTAGSVGEALADAAEGGDCPTADEIADAVWEEPQADHDAAGTFGEIATEIAEILQDTQALSAAASVSVQPRPVSTSTRVLVPRGEPVEILLDLELGSPGPTLLFTLARERNMLQKIWATAPVSASPSHVVAIPSSVTNIEPRTYWWDVWDMDAERLLIMGTLIVSADVRLP